MLWIKAFHIVFMVTWFAALFYLPRLFVYHAMAEDAASIARFKIMERKLYYGIMYPGAVLTTILGFLLVSYQPSYYLQAHWMQLKLLLVVLLWAYHFSCGHYLKQFKRDKNKHSHIFYRCFNEVPVVILIAIVILVVVKPF